MAFGKKKDDAAAEAETAPAEGPTPEASVETAPVAAPAPAAPAAAPAESSDALLSMFQATKEDVDDLTILVDLAGETDLDDILEELRTLRAALGITDSDEEEEDLAAAA